MGTHPDGVKLLPGSVKQCCGSASVGRCSSIAAFQPGVFQGLRLLVAGFVVITSVILCLCVVMRDYEQTITSGGIVELGAIERPCLRPSAALGTSGRSAPLPRTRHRGGSTPCISSSLAYAWRDQIKGMVSVLGRGSHLLGARNDLERCRPYAWDIDSWK